MRLKYRIITAELSRHGQDRPCFKMSRGIDCYDADGYRHRHLMNAGMSHNESAWVTSDNGMGIPHHIWTIR